MDNAEFNLKYYLPFDIIVATIVGSCPIFYARKKKETIIYIAIELAWKMQHSR